MLFEFAPIGMTMELSVFIIIATSPMNSQNQTLLPA